MSTSQPLSFGIQTLGLPWTDLAESWLRYEADGWDTLWIPDHLSTPDGVPGPFLESWVALAALAGLTSTARIGVLVSSNTFRHPSVLAKQAITVDHVSDGRLVLGLGAGWYEWEHEAFGIDLPETGLRVSRFAEALALVDRFLRNDTTSFDGAYYTLREAPNRPPPIQRPRMPIIVGAHGPRTIRIAARHANIWNSRGTVDEMRERSARLDDACVKAGRDPADVTRSVCYFPSRTEQRPWESAGAFADWVGQYRAIGFTDFIFDAPPGEQRDIAERIAREVLPELRKG